MCSLCPKSLAEPESILSDARGWLLECLLEDINLDQEEAEELIASKTDDQILRKINRLYSGGLRQFIRDGNY